MTTERPLALVTGASSGIGATFARRLAARGYDLVLVARRKERLEELAREIEDNGARAGVLVADLADEADLERVAEHIGGFDRLDLLVNNAGFGARGLFFDTDLASQDRMHRLHVLATVRLTHAALKGMVARNSGGIINVSSVAAFWGSPNSTSYTATKAWMNSFTEGLHLELKSRGSAVKVQALCPGFTYSEFHDVAGMDRKAIPASWWMTAEDVVDASLRGLDEGRLIVIPGARYRLIVLLRGLMPRSWRHAGILWFARRVRRQNR